MALFHTIGLAITATDMASGIIRRVEKSLGALGPAGKQAAAGIAGAFVGIQGMQFGFDALKGISSLTEGAGRFEQRLGQLKVAAKGAGAGFIEMAKSRALEAGLTSRSDPNEAVEGMQELAKAGLRAKDVLGMLNEALELVNATQGEMKVGEAGKMMAMIRAAFSGANVPTSKLIVNAAAKYAMETQASLTEVPKVISRMLGGALSMEQSFPDMMASAAVARLTNSSAEMMSTSLRYIMQKLAGAEGAEKFMKVTGVNVKDAAGNFKPLLSVMAEMDANPLFKRMDKSARSQFFDEMFGSRQTSAIQGMRKVLNDLGVTFNENGKEITLFGKQAADRMLKEFRESANTNVIAQFGKADEATLGGIIDRITAKLVTLKTLIGDAFVPILKPIAAALNEFFGHLGRFLESLPAQVKTALAGMVLLGIGMTIAFFGTVTLISGLLVLAAVLSMIGAKVLAFLAVPMLIAGAAIGTVILLGAAFYAAWSSNIAGLKDTFGGFFGKVTLGFKMLSQLFQRGGIWGDVYDKMMLPENQGLFKFMVNLWVWMHRIKNFFVGMWEGFTRVLKHFDGPLLALMQTFRDLLALFGVTVDSAGKNEEAFKSWGEAGKWLGDQLGYLANIAILMLAVAMEAMIELIQLAQAATRGEGVIGGMIRMMRAGLALDEMRFGDAWELLTDAQRKGPLSDRISEQMIGGAAFHYLSTPNDLMEQSPRLGTDTPLPPSKPTSSLDAVMPAMAALQTQVRSSAAVHSVTTPTVNVEPPQVVAVFKFNERTFMEAIASAQHGQDVRGFLEGPRIPHMERG